MEDHVMTDETTRNTNPAQQEATLSGIETDRRTVLKGAAAVGGVMAGFTGPTYLRDFNFTQTARAQGSAPVKLGFIEDESGNLAVYGLQKLHAAQLAVKEINEGKTLRGAPNIGAGFLASAGDIAGKPPVVSKEGVNLDLVGDPGEKHQSALLYEEVSDILIDSKDKGILGREVSLVSADGQSNNTVWQQLARRMIQQDKVDVLVAGFASAEREAIRPIVDQARQLYFYTNQYEGGVADANTFCTGPVCEQQVIPTVQYMVEKFGPRGYTIAADYNFGQLTAAWAKAFIPLVGGQIIGEEFIPLSVSEFSQVIQRIQGAKPDWVMTLLVGSNHHNYYPQAAAAGLKLPMASTVNMAQGYEHKRFPPPSMANMHNAIQYQMEVPTARNRAFVRRWMEMFPQDQYIGEMAQNTYFTIHLYAKAARLAGKTDQATVKKALELGWNIEAPEGSVFLEPGTHHCAHPIRLAVCDENHNVSFVRDWPMIQAWWLQRLGVNLIRNPEYKQYTPAEDPYFTMFGKA
jgi:branched-chain amino acid transport system substrate-binding protein